MSKLSKGSKKISAKAAKAAKSAKVAKPAAKKEKGESTGRRGRAPAWPLDTKIKVVAKENPKRAGSAAAKRFDLYKDNNTVGTFLAAGGTSGDLHWDSTHGHIEIK